MRGARTTNLKAKFFGKNERDRGPPENLKKQHLLFAANPTRKLNDASPNLGCG